MGDSLLGKFGDAMSIPDIHDARDVHLLPFTTILNVFYSFPLP